jgi:GlpG protein
MRMIGSIPNQQLADRFGDYLITLDMDHSLEQSAGGHWDVWIVDDDELDRGKLELGQFLASPDGAKYNVGHKARTIRDAEEHRQEKRRNRFVDVRTSWSIGTGSYRVTLALVILTGITTAVTWLGERLEPVGVWLLFSHVTISGDSASWDGWDSILHGQVWRLFTPMFIHFGFIHFLFNMFWLRDLGAVIEDRQGPRRLLLLVLFCSAAGNVAQYWWSETPFFGGMSGVVYGLFGYAWMKSRFQPHLNIGISDMTVMILLAFLALGVIGAIGGGRTANAAHIGGLLTGMILGYAPVGWSRLRRGR